MEYSKLYFFSIIISLSLSLFHCFSFTVKDTYDKYCFKKYIYEGDEIAISFVSTSYPKELIKANLTYQKEKYDTKKLIYEVIDKERGDYTQSNISEAGYYELCFYSKKGKQYRASMEFDSFYQEHNIKKLASDKELKAVNKEIKEMKNAIHKMEINSRHITNMNYEHISTMKSLIISIKKLTYLKIFVIALMSLFQIYIIHKLFGPDKRVTKIKGFSDKNNIL